MVLDSYVNSHFLGSPLKSTADCIGSVYYNIMVSILNC